MLLVNCLSSFHMNRAKGTGRGGGKPDSPPRLTPSVVLGIQQALPACVPARWVMLEPWLPVGCLSALMAMPGFNGRHEKVAVPKKSATYCCLHHAERAPSSRGEERTLLPTPADLPERNNFAHQRSRQVVANGHISPRAQQQTVLSINQARSYSPFC